MISYQEGIHLLHRYGGDAPWIRHCIAVSSVAERVAHMMTPFGVLEPQALVVGALLHDIGRYKTHDPILHGMEGYRLLTGLGHHQEACICASHVPGGISRQEAVRHGLPDQDFFPRTFEEHLVPVIDSVVEFDRPTTIDERCSSIRRRYSNNPDFIDRFEKAADAAKVLSSSLRTDYGIGLEQIAVEVLCRDSGNRP